jgi:hypothetical protein
MNHEIANNGRWVSIISVVTGLNVVNQRALVLFPARTRDFSVILNIQIGYGAHRAYCSMCAWDKAVVA